MKKLIAIAMAGVIFLTACTQEVEQSPLTKELGGQAMTTTLYKVTERTDDGYVIAKPVDQGVVFDIVLEGYEIGDNVMVGTDENGDIVTEKKVKKIY